MRVSLLAGALAQAAAALVVGWVVGHAGLRWVGGRLAAPTPSGMPEGVGLPERLLAAACGFVAFACALMAVHVVTAGAVFGNPVAVPTAAVAVVVAGIRRSPLPRRIPWAAVCGIALLLFCLYELPLVLSGTGVRTGDTPWHMGWTNQLLGGQALPAPPAPRFAANAYPWGYHAVAACLVRLVPGSDALAAQEALHLLMLAFTPAAAACLARRLDGRAGWAGALCVAAVGGWGWISAPPAHFDPSPDAARYGADLVSASPNSVYSLLAPALPRELGLVLVGATGVGAILALRTADRRWAVAAGACAGLTGLVSVPAFVAALAWLAAGVAVSPSERARIAAAFALPAVTVFALWAAPVAAAWLRYGGFVDASTALGREWPIPQALWAWGLLVPLAVAGLVLAARSGTSAARVLLGFAGATVVLMALARMRAAFDWQLAHNPSVLHQGRVWPVAHLLAAALAGVALARGARALAARSPRAAVAAVALVLAVGAASPATAAAGFARVVARQEDGYVYSGSDFAPDGFVRSAAEVLGPGDVVSAPRGADNVLGFLLFQFSGARLVGHVDERHAGNELRIRYRELARAYRAARGSGVFDADYAVVPTAGATPAQVRRAVVSGPFRGRTWLLVPKSG